MTYFSRDWSLELATTIMSYYIIKLEDISYFYPDNLYLQPTKSFHFNGNAQSKQSSLNGSVWLWKLQELCWEKIHISLSLSPWPNDLSLCDHCASNGGLMPNKNHWDDKCDVKRSFPGFLLQILSSEKFLPPQSDSGSVPRSDRVTNTGGQGFRHLPGRRAPAI